MRRVTVVVLALLATVSFVTGCGSGGSSAERTRQDAEQQAQQQAQQQSTAAAEASLRSLGFTKVTLRIRRADGSVEVHCVWLADSDVERERGLMEITDPSLGGAEAMVFSFDTDTSAAFWMKDTVLPLSVAWIDATSGFVGSADMDPCPPGSTSCPQFPPARRYRMAIEMPKGRLQEWGIEPGSVITLGEAC